MTDEAMQIWKEACKAGANAYYAAGEQPNDPEGVKQSAILRKAAAAVIAEALAARDARIAELEGALNTPEVNDFVAGVVSEAQHQRERWGVDHDAGKEPEDWFWLIGYLAGKALHAAKAGDQPKALHHTISTAAALANWHAAISGHHNRMRPGIEPPQALENSIEKGRVQ